MVKLFALIRLTVYETTANLPRHLNCLDLFILLKNEHLEIEPLYLHANTNKCK